MPKRERRRAAKGSSAAAAQTRQAAPGREQAAEPIKAGVGIDRGVLGMDEPARAVIDVDADRVERPGERRERVAQVGDDQADTRIVDAVLAHAAQVRARPLDDRRLDLAHDHLGHSRVPQRLVEREADAEAAEQDAQPAAVGQRLAYERPLGAAVARVHEERPVRDHLEMRARSAQDELPLLGAAALDDDRPVVVSEPVGLGHAGQRIGPAIPCLGASAPVG